MSTTTKRRQWLCLQMGYWHYGVTAGNKEGKLSYPFQQAVAAQEERNSYPRLMLFRQLPTLKWGGSWLYPFWSLRYTACTWVPWVSHVFSPLIQAVTRWFYYTKDEEAATFSLFSRVQKKYREVYQLHAHFCAGCHSICITWSIPLPENV